MKILMVCRGNICRSPMAQGIMEKLIADHQLDWIVDSAATGEWSVGKEPDKRAIATMAKYGIDITGQRARRIRSTDFEEFDIVYAMDTRNQEELFKWTLDPKENEKVRLILNSLHPGENLSVPDPDWDDDGFETAYTLLRDACEAIIGNKLAK